MERKSSAGAAKLEARLKAGTSRSNCFRRRAAAHRSIALQDQVGLLDPIKRRRRPTDAKGLD